MASERALIPKQLFNSGIVQGPQQGPGTVEDRGESISCRLQNAPDDTPILRMPIHRSDQGIENQHLDEVGEQRVEIIATKGLQKVRNEIDAVKRLLFPSPDVVQFFGFLQLLVLEIIFNDQTSVTQGFVRAGEDPGNECRSSVQKN